ncbi:unnamed protein product [Mesocestoides corti]|uniref:Cilia- and flagella-associated protein 263 n=1 Tax=Mesocestoides corti TaxID=53468 RepID=A0A0R3U3U4_MESCO|nr:unnamed protein product [Mesocestoides corti]
MAERLVRFIEEILKSQDTLVDKLRLNNTTLRFQRKKLFDQQRQKEEMGEVLHEVDFEQLRIENAQFLEIIDEKNQELLHLKLTAGRILQASTALRRKLHQVIQESATLQVEIKSREEMLVRTKAEIELVKREAKQIEAQIANLRQLMADYSVPPVMSYVDSVREMRRLKRKAKIQERKVEIAKINLNRYRRMWQHLKQADVMP